MATFDKNLSMIVARSNSESGNSDSSIVAAAWIPLGHFGSIAKPSPDFSCSRIVLRKRICQFVTILPSGAVS